MKPGEIAPKKKRRTTSFEPDLDVWELLKVVERGPISKGELINRCLRLHLNAALDEKEAEVRKVSEQISAISSACSVESETDSNQKGIEAKALGKRGKRKP